MVSSAGSRSTSSKTTTGRLAAELQVDSLERARGVLGDPLARLDRARERDHVDVVVGDERGAGLVAAGDDVQDAARHGVGGELGEPQRSVMGVVGAGLSTTVLPRGQRGGDLPDRHHQRVVPRRDLADDSDRLAPHHRRVALDVLAGALPSRLRAAPAKNAQLVDDSGDLVGLHRVDRLAGVGGLDPRRARRRAPRRCPASVSRMSWRCAGVVCAYVVERRRAALTARPTSSAPDDGAWPSSCPVAGLRIASVRPSAAPGRAPRR